MNYFEIINNNFDLTTENQIVGQNTFYYLLINFNEWNFNLYKELMQCLWELAKEPFDTRVKYQSELFHHFDYIHRLIISHCLQSNSALINEIEINDEFKFSKDEFSIWFYVFTLRQSFLNIFNPNHKQNQKFNFETFWKDMEQEYKETK